MRQPGVGGISHGSSWYGPLASLKESELWASGCRWFAMVL